MKPSWQLVYTEYLLELNDCCLQLINPHSGKRLRCWSSELAHQLFINVTQTQHPAIRHSGNRICIDLDKNLTQHFLMQACFHHQRCLQQYQVHQDLTHTHLTHTNEMAEVLLYIRMTDQHPCHETLVSVMDLSAPHNLDVNQQINHLIKLQLIQQIEHNDQIFYDKNPLPHKHVYDPNKAIVLDFHRHMDTAGLDIIQTSN